MTAIGFEQVSKRYAERGPLALDDVTWSVPVGARACLLGPNGAGKSTCIRLVQGALQPNRGHVTLLGANVGDAHYQNARRRTGIVPQAPGMYTDLTCAEYLDLAHRLYGRGDLQRVVDVFGLGNELPKRMHQLSGGFQRRLVLAAALLGEPDVLLLDEPTVGLDPVAQHDVLAFLREAMQRDKRTTLLCTHNLAEAEALCQEVIILRHGKVRIQASLAELRGRARPRLRLAAHQGPTPLLAALADRGLAGEPDHDGGALVSVDAPQQLAPSLLRALLSAGIDIYACEPVEASLNDLFLDLVRD
jgi:ABC-2 type transport system ATP-binding protein